MPVHPASSVNLVETPIKRVAIRSLRRPSRRRKRKEVYDVEFASGFIAVLIPPPAADDLLSCLNAFHPLFNSGGVAIVARPDFCGPCKRSTTHAYYAFNNTVRCLYCDNPIGSNDTRPSAQILRLF